ncbi:MAG TPA: hypothetical protein VK425_02805 [Acidimicrobiales bacterium]|nr:hypothetical protein [Acidimicrobiales bacterium]
MTKVVTLGEILVEIMAKDRGQGFRQPVQLAGPFPSGAPAIFIDQVAKLGQPCGITWPVLSPPWSPLSRCGRRCVRRLERWYQLTE